MIAAASIGLLGIPPAAAGQRFVPAPIDWGPCQSEPLREAKAECGYLEVPLDYRAPDRGKVSLAVSRVRHSTAQSQGVVLVNPGGPGVPGLELSTLGKQVPGHAGDAYDWIGFDTRGVGASKPALSCDPAYFGYHRPEYVPSTPRLEQTWLDRSRRYAEACAKNGPLLEHLRTTDIAQDMESLRKALGEERINYYGYSWGTYLGQVYGTLYPHRVRRMILDSNVDPRHVGYRATLNQDIAFERNIKIFFGWVAKYDHVFHLGRTGQAVEALFYAQQRELARNPAGGLIGPSEWSDLFLRAGFYSFGWEPVARAFANWMRDGDWQTLKALYDSWQTPGNDNGFAAYHGGACTDTQWPRWARYRSDTWETHRQAPFLTWTNGWYDAPCLFWPVKPGRPVDIDGAEVPSALLIGETLDGSTPFQGSLEVRARFPRSSLIAVTGGTTHAGSLLFSPNPCVSDQIAGYLATGELPPRKPGNGPDTECAAPPEPTPESHAPVTGGREWLGRF